MHFCSTEHLRKTIFKTAACYNTGLARMGATAITLPLCLEASAISQRDRRTGNCIFKQHILVISHCLQRRLCAGEVRKDTWFPRHRETWLGVAETQNKHHHPVNFKVKNPMPFKNDRLHLGKYYSSLTIL